MAEDRASQVWEGRGLRAGGFVGMQVRLSLASRQPLGAASPKRWLWRGMCRAYVPLACCVQRGTRAEGALRVCREDVTVQVPVS